MTNDDLEKLRELETWLRGMERMYEADFANEKLAGRVIYKHMAKPFHERAAALSALLRERGNNEGWRAGYDAAVGQMSAATMDALATQIEAAICRVVHEHFDRLRRERLPKEPEK